MNTDLKQLQLMKQKNESDDFFKNMLVDRYIVTISINKQIGLQ